MLLDSINCVYILCLQIASTRAISSRNIILNVSFDWRIYPTARIQFQTTKLSLYISRLCWKARVGQTQNLMSTATHILTTFPIDMLHYGPIYPPARLRCLKRFSTIFGKALLRVDTLPYLRDFQEYTIALPKAGLWWVWISNCQSNTRKAVCRHVYQGILFSQRWYDEVDWREQAKVSPCSSANLGIIQFSQSTSDGRFESIAKEARWSKKDLLLARSLQRDRYIMLTLLQTSNRRIIKFYNNYTIELIDFRFGSRIQIMFMNISFKPRKT